MMGPETMPTSSMIQLPVISPVPLIIARPAVTLRDMSRPSGRMAVTPVRTGPLPGTTTPSPSMSVTWPTSTPSTSVMELSGPGVPSKGTPRSRARGDASARTSAGSAIARTRMSSRTVMLIAPGDGAAPSLGHGSGDHGPNQRLAAIHVDGGWLERAHLHQAVDEALDDIGQLLGGYRTDVAASLARLDDLDEPLTRTPVHGDGQCTLVLCVTEAADQIDVEEIHLTVLTLIVQAGVDELEQLIDTRVARRDTVTHVAAVIPQAPAHRLLTEFPLAFEVVEDHAAADTGLLRDGFQRSLVETLPGKQAGCYIENLAPPFSLDEGGLVGLVPARRPTGLRRGFLLGT